MASVDLGKVRAILIEVEAIRRRIAGTNMTFVQGVLSRAREIDSAEREVRRREAPRFNIFETMNVLDTELVHSNFLAFLLDPRATHDQGIFFLQSFLERFLKKPVPTVEDSFVQSEFVTPNGRLDVVLLLHTRAVICIENKVREMEQEDQIRRYQNYLESLQQPTHRLVIFLSPMGELKEWVTPRPFLAEADAPVGAWSDAARPSMPICNLAKCRCNLVARVVTRTSEKVKGLVAASHCSISGKDDMIGSTKRRLWLVILMAAGGAVTPLLAAEYSSNQGMRMSFDRACKRLASDVVGAVSGDHRDQTRTMLPRASREFPLQQPPHPPEAPDQGGTVVLDIFVTEAGLVSEVRVSQSSGHQVLDLAAMKITERWRLLPGTISGEPVCMWGKFAVVFRVDEK